MAQRCWSSCGNELLATHARCLAQDLGSRDRFRDSAVYLPDGLWTHQFQRRDRIPVRALPGPAARIGPQIARSQLEALTGAPRLAASRHQIATFCTECTGRPSGHFRMTENLRFDSLAA